MGRVHDFDGVSPMADLRRKNGREKAWKVDYFGAVNEIGDAAAI